MQERKSLGAINLSNTNQTSIDMSEAGNMMTSNEMRVGSDRDPLLNNVSGGNLTNISSRGEEPLRIAIPNNSSFLSRSISKSSIWTPDNIASFGYMILNVSSSVGIVLTNKAVYKVHEFNFGTTLTVIHFIVTWLGLKLCCAYGLFEHKRLKFRDVMGLCWSFCGFVVLTNMSLLHNSVGFYQMAKVLTTPCIVLIQSTYYKTTFSSLIKASLVVTCVGVAISSASDVQLNLTGTLYALAGVVVTSLYQIWVGTRQKELEVNAMQLLYYQAPISAVILLVFVPFFDDVSELFMYDLTHEAAMTIFVTAVLAFFVNMSVFLLIGKTSAITYNIVGHFKLCLIVTLGMILFDYDVSWRNILGILITLTGVFWYSHIRLVVEAPAESGGSKSDAASLLKK